MNVTRSRIAAYMAIVISILAIIASLEGIFNKAIYDDVVRLVPSQNHYCWVLWPKISSRLS